MLHSSALPPVTVLVYILLINSHSLSTYRTQIFVIRNEDSEGSLNTLTSSVMSISFMHASVLLQSPSPLIHLPHAFLTWSKPYSLILDSQYT